jgi:hypothetical protein
MDPIFGDRMVRFTGGDTGLINSSMLSMNQIYRTVQAHVHTDVQPERRHTKKILLLLRRIFRKAYA